MPPSGMKNQVEEAKNTSIKNQLLVLPYKRERKKYCGVSWLSLLHNLIQESLNAGSVQVQILFAAC